MISPRPQGSIDKNFAYFLAGSLGAHLLILLGVFFFQIFVPRVTTSTITINLGVSGGNGLPAPKAPRAPVTPPVVRRKPVMTIPQKRTAEKHAAEQFTGQTTGAEITGTAGTTGVSEGGTGGEGTGAGGGQGVVSSNQLDSQPSLVEFSNPVYPVEARRQGKEGVVVLKALIAPDGKVQQVHVVKSIPIFDRSAVDAVEHWRFTAITSHGKPVYVWMIIPIRFQLR